MLLKLIRRYLQWTLENSSDRDREILENLFEEHPWIRNTCELACRKAKEKYFSEPEAYDDGYYATSSEDIQGRCLFVARLDSTIMSELLETPVLNIDGEMKTWPSAFEDELRKLKQQVESEKGSAPGVILLTGGASRMRFIHEICRKTFSNASIKSDDNPEFCITKGLARWGRVELNTEQSKKI